MSSDILRVQWDDVPGVQDLAEAVMANEEPGYQIEGVREYSELRMVFSSIRLAVPRQAARFNSVFSPKRPANKEDVPHVDGTPGTDTSLLYGLAIHHNISDTSEIELGTADKEFNFYPRTAVRGIDLTRVVNFRHGETTPGMLTVFSEGNMDALRPTAHYFRRPDTERPHRWTRYSNMPIIQTVPLYSRWIARRTIAEVKQYTKS
jgi:hypothetical protein